jgi:putative hydrolase of the HAD superfamily
LAHTFARAAGKFKPSLAGWGRLGHLARMIKQRFSRVSTWVFDLDNTLYPPKYRLFDQIERRINAWVASALNIGQTEASRLRQHYWDTYGTTLAGLMAQHKIDAAAYLANVHDIDFSVLPQDPALAEHLRALKGRKIVFTNATAPYAEKVLAARGLSGIFDAVYGVEEAGFCPKPHAAAFETVFATDGLTQPQNAAMFEDDARNLAVPHELGMECVYIAPKPKAAQHIHHHHKDLTQFLGKLLG